MTERRLDDAFGRGDPTATHGAFGGFPVVLELPERRTGDKLKHNPYSYIQVINPDVEDIDTPRGTPAFFEEVRAEYDALNEGGWLARGTRVACVQTIHVGPADGSGVQPDLARCAEGGCAHMN